MAVKKFPGARFKKLSSKLATRPGVKNPGALAADISRGQYGKKKLPQMSAKGRK